jgi:alpha-glucoside transport system substrate-binding protein
MEPPWRRRRRRFGGSVTIWAEWTSTEQQDFKAVLQPFEDSTGIKVQYTGKGSNMDTALDAAVAGGSPPAVALVPDPGTLDTLAAKHAIKPLASIIGTEANELRQRLEHLGHLQEEVVWSLV